MATGKATVVAGSGNSVKDAVHQSTGDAVRAAQNAGATKKDVIKARDAAKADTYNKIAANISVGGPGSQRQIAEIQNNPDLIQDIKNTGMTQNIATDISRNHDVRMGVDPALYNAAQKGFQNPKNLKQVAMRQINSKPPSAASDTIAMYGSVRQNKNVDESVQVAKTYVRGGSFLAASVFGVSMLHPDNPNRLYDVTESWKKLDENIVAGYYGEETADTKKIDDHSNKATDVLDGVTTTLIDPGRLRKSHENPNMLAVDTNTDFGKFADTVLITRLDNFAKSDNIFSRFVRGGTLDNAAGITTLGSEVIKTGSTMIQDAPGALREGGIEGVGQSAADTFASSAGRLLGGTAAALVDDPVAFAGSVVVPGAVKVGGKVGKVGVNKVTGIVRTAGKTDLPVDNIVTKKIKSLEGDVHRERMNFPDNYPTENMASRTVDHAIKMLEDTKDLYPLPDSIPQGYDVMIHGHPNSWGNSHYGRLGKHGDPGTFGGPNLSEKFLRVPEIKIAGLGFGNPLNDLKSVKSGIIDVFYKATGKRDLFLPSVEFIAHKGYRRLPTDIRLDSKAARRWMITEADPNYAYITSKLEKNTAAGKAHVEIEAAITPGAEFKLIENQFKTKTNQPISIFGKEGIPGTNIKFQTGLDVPANLQLATGKMKTIKRQRATGIVSTDSGILLVMEKNGLLNLPGGGVDKFEFGSKAVARELAEETGAKSKTIKKSFNYTDQNLKRSNHGGLYFNEHLVYDVELKPGEKPIVKQKTEISGLRYWEQGTPLPKELNIASKNILLKRFPDAVQKGSVNPKIPKQKIPAILGDETAKKTKTTNRKSKQKKQSEYDYYNSKHAANDPIYLVDLTYGSIPKTPKPKKSGYSKTLPKVQGKSILASSNYNKILSDSKSSYPKSKTQSKNQLGTPFIKTIVQEKTKRNKTEELLGLSKRKTTKKSDNVLKELRVNVIGDLKL